MFVLLGVPTLTSQASDRGAVTDGSAVLTAGRLHMNVTNWGLLGSRYSVASTFSLAPSLQWPGGTSHEYLYAAGLWVGARKNGTLSVTCGQPSSELSPPTTADGRMYEAENRVIVRPAGPYGVTGTPGDVPGGDDDNDGLVDEEILDGRDQDGDGLIDEDFAQRGSQMFACTLLDDTRLLRQLHPDHRPLGIRVHQEACAWDEPGLEDIIGLRFVITNISNVPLQDVYVGLFLDADIGRHNDLNSGGNDLAGTFHGLVRQPEDYFEDFDYVWMRDGHPDDAMPGWVGVTMDGFGLGDRDAVHPEDFPLNALRVVNLLAGGGNLGLPLSDAERYTMLSRPGHDVDVEPWDTGNYAVLLSAGPYLEIEPGEHVVVDVAITMGTSHETLQKQIRKARDASDGRWYDGDHKWWTGRSGRETLICAEDYFTPWNHPDNPLYDIYMGYWDDSCRNPRSLIFPYEPSNFFWDDDLKKHCNWMNLDNCDECRRYFGVTCDGYNHSRAPCYSSSDRARGACTGSGGREVRLPNTSAVSLPPSPWIRAEARDRAVEIYWDDRSEHVPDDLSGEIDFEAYRVWQAANWRRPPGTSEDTGPPSHAWSMRSEFDLPNFFPPQDGAPARPFGANTGLDHLVYSPVCLDDSRFDGLAEAMAEVILADTQGRYSARPYLRDALGAPIPELIGLLPWESYGDVLDTFFAVTERPDSSGTAKRPVRYYRWTDEHLHNGFIYFYAVTATDHHLADDGETPDGLGSGRLPSGSFVAAIPRTAAHRADQARDGVYVYPNPATRAALEEFQALAPSKDDPSGVRVAFANLPRCPSTIQIFSLAGDLIYVTHHDGSHGDGQTSWNLISRNGQEVTSGIYLFVVEPHDSAFDRSVGKFVLVR